MKSTVSGVIEDLKFKISEGYKQNWSLFVGVFLYLYFHKLKFWLPQLNWDSQQGRDRKTPILVLAFWNFKVKVLKCQWNFRPQATVIWNLVKPLQDTLQIIWGGEFKSLFTIMISKNKTLIKVVIWLHVTWYSNSEWTLMSNLIFEGLILQRF